MDPKSIEESHGNRQEAFTRLRESILDKEGAADSFQGPLDGSIIWTLIKIMTWL